MTARRRTILVSAVAVGLLRFVAAAEAQGGRPPVGAGAPARPPASPAPSLLPPPPARVAGAVARVVGTLFDSLAMRPISGAMVQLVAADDPSRVRSVTTNERGAYAIDSVRTGVYLLGFFHPRLDSLSLESPLLRVDIRTSDEIVAPLSLPSGRTLIARLCGAQVAQDSLGLFMGYVRSARGETLPAPARIRASWAEITLGPRGIERRSPSHFANTSPSGLFAICGIPTNGTFMTRAFIPGDSSGFVELEAPKNGFLYRDIYIGTATKVESSALRGAGRLRGVVRSTTGQPITGAKVVLWGSGLEATTSNTGQFNLQTLPSGTYTLESRAIGFMPMRAAVDVLEGTEGVADVAMNVFVPTVDTVKVRANRSSAMDPFADFEKRRKAGFGYFIDSDYLNRRNATFMSDLLRATPGITISPGQLSGDKVTMRGSAGAGSCVPAVYLNGAPVYVDDGNLDAIVNTQEVRAVEVYTRTGSMPIQFQTMNGCGSIVIWTGARAPSKPNP